MQTLLADGSHDPFQQLLTANIAAASSECFLLMTLVLLAWPPLLVSNYLLFKLPFAQ